MIIRMLNGTEALRLTDRYMKRCSLNISVEMQSRPPAMFYIPCYKYVFAASRGMVESKCHVDSVANDENLPKGSTNRSEISKNREIRQLVRSTGQPQTLFITTV